MKNVCIVGFGMIGPIHAVALSKIEGVKLYAVCDVDQQRIDKCKNLYDVISYTDFDEMLCDTNIDSVHICTPHYLHFEMIKKTLAAGKGVVCEKPLTMTREQYDELLTLDGAQNVCVVLQNRLNPCVEKFREIVQSEELGKITAVKGILTWHRTAEYYARDAWRGKWDTEGGGVLINQAIHTLDFFSYIAGGVSSLKAQMINFSLDTIEVEDTFCAKLDLTSGTSGIFFATNAYAKNSSPQFEIAFEKGEVKYMGAKLYLDGKLIEEESKPSVGKAYWGNGHEKLFRNYYEENEFFSPFDVRNTMNTLFSMYESAKKNGKKITVL